LKAIGWLLRAFAYLFHTVLSAALIAIGGVALITGPGTLRIEMLPWQGSQLATWMTCLGVIGLLSVLMAMLGKFRYVFTLWAFAVLVMLIRGVFFASGVSFAGSESFQNALWLIAGALVAFLGSLTKPPRAAAA
jgi:hypothetical protein